MPILADDKVDRFRKNADRAYAALSNSKVSPPLLVAGLCGLVYGLADVIDAVRANGVISDLIVIGGGAGRSALVRQIMADTTGLPVAIPETQEPVMLGAAMLAAVASGTYGSIGQAMSAMSALGCPSEPTAPEMAAFHRAKRNVHALMRELDQASRHAMQGQQG